MECRLPLSKHLRGRAGALAGTHLAQPAPHCGVLAGSPTGGVPLPAHRPALFAAPDPSQTTQEETAIVVKQVEDELAVCKVWRTAHPGSRVPAHLPGSLGAPSWPAACKPAPACSLTPAQNLALARTHLSPPATRLAFLRLKPVPQRNLDFFEGTAYQYGDEIKRLTTELAARKVGCCEPRAKR